MTRAGDFDHERYRASVLEPARLRGNVLPADLLVRYALHPALMADGDRFTAHVQAVVNYWRTLKQRRSYAALAEALLSAHADLERRGLDPEKLAEQQRKVTGQARERLRQLADGLSRIASCVGAAAPERLATTLGGVLDAAAVKAALEEHGVRVVDLPELPQSPPRKYGDIRRNLRVLDRRLSAEVVLGDRVREGFGVLHGFRLASGGPNPLRAAIQPAGEELAKAPQDDRKTAAANVLSILQAESAKPGALDALLLWEVIELLRPLVDGGLPQRLVADQAVELGLDRHEAAVLAAALVEQRGGRALTAEVLAAEEALAEGELRTAQQLAAPLPDGEAVRDLRARLDAAAARVATLGSDADRARAEGRTEDAAVLLVEACRIARDDPDLERSLRDLPPPPPDGVRATVDGDRVVVGWGPSPVRTGGVRYRVVRMSGRAAAAAQHGPRLGETDGRQLVDPSPPVGESLSYGVLAVRDTGAGWSSMAVSGPVVVLPEVADLRLVADRRSITGSWRAHPRAREVVVTRRELQPPRTSTDGQLLRPVTLMGFVDGGVRTGLTYYYRVSAVYLTNDGDRRVSSGVVASATPAAPPAAVTDLELTTHMLASGHAVHVTWTPPGGGAVSIHLSDARPPWPRGASVAPAELAAFAHPLPGTPERLPDQRVRLAVPQVYGRRFLTAATVGATGALIGNTVELAMVEPVRGLAAERLDNVVRLSWVWPAESTAARVRWWATGASPDQPLGERRCLRHVYAEQGGFEARVGPQAITVSVQAVIDERRGELGSATVTIDVAPLAAVVRYSIRRAGWRHRNKVMVVLSADAACALPPLVVVQRVGSVMPLGPYDGRVVARIPPQELDPSAPLSTEIPLAPAKGPSWLACFPEAGSGADITLVPPPVDELKVS